LRDTSGPEQWTVEGFEPKRAAVKPATFIDHQIIDAFAEALSDDTIDRCQNMVDALVDEAGDPRVVAELLFGPVARIMGDDWCADDCDFLKVTIAVSRMQRLFRRITTQYPPLATPDLARSALLAPAPGEQHTFGLSIVDDAMRRAAWEVDCCGCNEDAKFLRLAAANHYVIIGVSVSVGRLLPDLVSVITKARARSRNKSVVLMAGGSLAQENPQRMIDAGFDLVAVDAASAVALAEAAMAKHLAGAVQSMAAE
jgi:methanogenic corrinoid protein MtbC1